MHYKTLMGVTSSRQAFGPTPREGLWGHELKMMVEKLNIRRSTRGRAAVCAHPERHPFSHCTSQHCKKPARTFNTHVYCHTIGSCVAGLLLLVLAGLRIARADEEVKAYFMRVDRAPLPIALDDYEIAFKVGDRIPLFQVSKQYYIGLAETPYHGLQLVAIHRVDKSRQATAWVTKDKEIVFASPTHSADGVVYLIHGEELPVEKVESDAYVVKIERYGRTSPLRIPRGTPGLTIAWRPAPKAPETPEQQVWTTLRQTTVMTSRTPGNTRAVAINQPARTSTTGPNGMDASGTSTPPLTAEYTALQRDSAQEALKSITVSTMRNLVVIVIFVILVSMAAALILRAPKRSEGVHAQPRTELVSSVSDTDVATTVAVMPFVDSDMTGSLTGYVGVSDLVQFISSSRETGVLSIMKQGGTPVGQLFIEAGEIVHGKIDDDLPCEEAVCEVLKIRDGSFAFKRKDAINEEHTISLSTMSLLLEAAKSFDEQQA